MAYGRSSLYDRDDVAEHGDVTATAVSSTSSRSVSLIESREEIDTLRSINAKLIRQIAELKQREAQAQRLADRDGLTGLYNRRRMLASLETSIGEARLLGHGVGLLFLDLDGFKPINDYHGHAAGDQLLMSVASRISARARVGDVVCRYGGDEFVVILPQIADAGAAHRVADSIRGRVALPHLVDGIEVQVTAAIGVAVFPDDGRSAAALLNSADEAMYREKSGGSARDPNTGHDPVAAPAVPQSRRRDDSKCKGRAGVIGG